MTVPFKLYPDSQMPVGKHLFHFSVELFFTILCWWVAIQIYSVSSQNQKKIISCFYFLHAVNVSVPVFIMMGCGHSATEVRVHLLANTTLLEFWIFLIINSSFIQVSLVSWAQENISGNILGHSSQAVKKSSIHVTAAQLCTLYFHPRLICRVSSQSNVHWNFKPSFQPSSERG